MLTFLARSLLLIAAAVGLGAIGRRRDDASRRRLRRPSDGSRSSAGHSGPADTASPIGSSGAAIPDAAKSVAAFAGYGGSAVSAGYERVDAGSGVVSNPGSSKAATAREEGATAVSGKGVLPLAAPDIHGRTPTADERACLPDDTLAALHESDSFDRDFRSVDYGNLRDDVSSHARSGTEGFSPGSEVAGDAVFEASPAAFASGGSAAALRGAPDGDPGDGEEGGMRPLDEPGASAVSVAALEAPRDGRPDNLTLISGIGPSIERLLFENGIFHFDQIAGWSEEEARRIDALTGFRGRVARENWIAQASRFADERSRTA